MVIVGQLEILYLKMLPTVIVEGYESASRSSRMGRGSEFINNTTISKLYSCTSEYQNLF